MITILLISAALHALAFALLIRHARRAHSMRVHLGLRREASPHWHQKLNIPDRTHTRGDTLLETLAALLLCAVIAAAITAGLSDDEDFVWPLTPALQATSTDAAQRVPTGL